MVNPMFVRTHRSKEEINQAILTAIKNRNRSVSGISLSANINNHSRTKKYILDLITEGKIKEVEPTIFDHGNTKTCYILCEDVV